MSRNGVEFGVKVSALGDRWFTGPAGEIKGFLFPGFTTADGAPDIGDSAISESRGFGGTALSASPSQARLFGVHSKRRCSTQELCGRSRSWKTHSSEFRTWISWAFRLVSISAKSWR